MVCVNLLKQWESCVKMVCHHEGDKDLCITEGHTLIPLLLHSHVLTNMCY